MRIRALAFRLATCALTLLLTGLAPLRAATAQPNIIHIVADDLGWQDVGFNGCKDIKTPNLEALAAAGAKFNQFYVQPMCTPTRAALMTGRYPYRYGLQTAVIPSVSGYGLDTTEWLMPQCLKEAGYKTAIIGKWHLGHADKKYWPKQRGFDYQYGAMIGELDYFTHEEHGVVDWFRDNEQVNEKGYTTTLLGNDAVKYINAQDAKKPFYLYLTFMRRTHPTRRRRNTLIVTRTSRNPRAAFMRAWSPAWMTTSDMSWLRWRRKGGARTHSSSSTATTEARTTPCLRA
jgi:arylsulfatase A-like enzyme